MEVTCGCPPSAQVGVEIQGVYDGVLYWECARCGRRWHRFPEGHALRERAEKYVAERAA